MAKWEKEFDYASDPKTKKMAAGDSAIYFVESDSILRKVLSPTSEPFTLDNSKYSDDGLTSSSLIVERKGDNYSNYRLIFRGNVVYSPELAISNKELFDGLAAISTETHTVEDLCFDNSRLFVSDVSGAILKILHHTTSNRIKTSNDGKIQSGIHPELSVLLEAPTILNVGSALAVMQFYGMIQSHVLTINALEKVLHGKTSGRDYVFTPDGRYYPSVNQIQKLPAIIDMKTPSTEAPMPTEPELVPEQLMLDDIGGLEEVRKALKHVAFSFNHPDEMKKWGAERPQGVLLYGPPGTGKTSLAKALANEIYGDLWEIKSTEIFDKYLGNSEKNITAIFDVAKKKTRPTVMLFDEFEALIGSSKNGSSQTASEVIAIFKKEAATLSAANPNIIMVATTNHLDRIDESLIRAGRFDVKSYVGLPTENARVQIFATKISDMIHKLRTKTFIPVSQDVNMVDLAQKTEGMSGADIKEIIRRAAFAKAMEEAQMGGENTAPITQNDLTEIIRDMKIS